MLVGQDSGGRADEFNDFFIYLFILSLPLLQIEASVTLTPSFYVTNTVYF